MSAKKPDLESFWMPFTANRRYKADPRIFFESAAGMHYTAADGRRGGGYEILSGCHCIPPLHGITACAACR